MIKNSKFTSLTLSVLATLAGCVTKEDEGSDDTSEVDDSEKEVVNLGGVFDIGIVPEVGYGCPAGSDEIRIRMDDEDSANGTFLNGVRLESMVPRELQDGDEIELARVERGGVKLQFESATPSYGYGRDAHADDSFDPGRQTRVVRRPQQSGGDRF